MEHSFESRFFPTCLLAIIIILPALFLASKASEAREDSLELGLREPAQSPEETLASTPKTSELVLAPHKRAVAVAAESGTIWFAEYVWKTHVLIYLSY